MTEQKGTKVIQNDLKRLEEIAQWFEKEREFDVEEGLEKIKEGTMLVKSLKERLKDVENEFRELERELDAE